MKKSTSIVVGLVFFFTVTTFAQAGGFQLGVCLNGPTGVALKLWTNSSQAIDGAVSWSVSKQDANIYLHADYLWHDFDKFTIDGGKLPLYWGIGFRTDGDMFNNWAVRLALGSSYIYGDSIFDIFFEIAPLLNVYEDLLFTIVGAVGFRFFM
jgi:hypothetical protein